MNSTVPHGVEPSSAALSEGELGGIACNLWKRLGGTDLEWVSKSCVRESWTSAVADLMMWRENEIADAAHARGVLDAAKTSDEGRNLKQERSL